MLAALPVHAYCASTKGASPPHLLPPPPRPITASGNTSHRRCPPVAAGCLHNELWYHLSVLFSLMTKHPVNLQ